jgi:hypothetical protein
MTRTKKQSTEAAVREIRHYAPELHGLELRLEVDAAAGGKRHQ